MDAQDLVLDCFPFAEARQEPAIYRHGDDAPIQEGHWVIVAGPDFDAIELGQGRSQDIAWEVAAERLERIAA